MVFAVQCPNPKCRKYMLVEERDRAKEVVCLLCKTPFRIDAERGVVVVVEGAQAGEGGAGGAQGDVGTNDLDNVAGLLDPLDEVAATSDLATSDGVTPNCPARLRSIWIWRDG